MTFLKVVFWILFIPLILVLIALVVGIILSFVRVGIRLTYEEDEGVYFRIKYGAKRLFEFPSSVDPAKKAKKKRHLRFKRYLFGRTVEKQVDKVQKKANKIKDKKLIELDIKQSEKLTAKSMELKEEEARLNAEMKKADERVRIAEEAEASGNSLPDVTDPSEVEKLSGLKKKAKSLDIEGTVGSAKSFLEGFSFDSVMALLTLIGSETKEALEKTGHAILIKEADLSLSIHGKDAADTAIRYGKVSAVAFPATGRMVNTMRVRKYNLEVAPEFLGKRDSAELHLEVSFSPIRILTPFTSSGKHILKALIKTYKENKSAIEKADKQFEEDREEKLVSQTAENMTLSKANN